MVLFHYIFDYHISHISLDEPIIANHQDMIKSRGNLSSYFRQLLCNTLHIAMNCLLNDFSENFPCYYPCYTLFLDNVPVGSVWVKSPSLINGHDLNTTSVILNTDQKQLGLKRKRQSYDDAKGKGCSGKMFYFPINPYTSPRSLVRKRPANNSRLNTYLGRESKAQQGEQAA